MFCETKDEPRMKRRTRIGNRGITYSFEGITGTRDGGARYAGDFIFSVWLFPRLSPPAFLRVLLQWTGIDFAGVGELPLNSDYALLVVINKCVNPCVIAAISDVIPRSHIRMAAKRAALDAIVRPAFDGAVAQNWAQSPNRRKNRYR
jgi:hypothetical protein